MERPPSSLGSLLRRHATPAAVLVTGVLCALAASGYASRSVEAQRDARFATEVATTVEAIRARMDAYVATLRAARALHDAEGHEPDSGSFARFVAGLDLGRHYPGIQGLGWAKVVPPSALAAHEQAVRRENPGYAVWPPGDRPLYSSIVYLEPLDWRNRRAIGYDMFSDPTRRRAMERARDTGDVAATARVELVQEAGSERQAGFLMYLPVYAGAPRDVAARQRLITGWVFAPFRAADLLNGILSPRDVESLQLSIYDGAEEDPAALLYSSPGRRSRLARVERLEIAGRPWTVAFAAMEALTSRAERALPAAVLAVGLAVTALLFAITRADARSRARTEQAAARTAFLADVGKAVSATTDYEWSSAEIAALAARRIADACVIVLLEPQGPVWIVGHADTARAARAAARLRGTAPTAASALGIPEAIARAAPAVGDAPRPGRGAPSEARAAVEELEVRSHLTVPVIARGEPVGAIALLAEREPAVFEPEDVPLAEDLARLLAAAVDGSRLLRREQEAVAARDEFLSVASHELKTPLTSLILHTDALRAAARRGSPEQLAGRADLIRRSADRLTRLVASLLDISRIGAGRLDLEREKTDLAEVTREVAQRFEEEAHRSGCELRLDVTSAVGFWDRMRVDQVVTNLLANALKYGAGAPIDVRVQADEGRAVLTVKDRGIGISEADQRRIFQRFERAVSQRNYGGFGLGLWIVRQIVEAQGGTVRVESGPGEGSTFTVELETGLATHPAPGGPRPPAPAPDETRA